MSRPVLLVVVSDETLQVIERDLRHVYEDQYRILGAHSATSALEKIRQLKQENERVALILVDQRMPEMTGVDFLRQAIRHFPDTKRVLLTPFTDAEAAISAIKAGLIDHYLVKPCQPPEQDLYPAIKDLLADWESRSRPPFEGLRIVGCRFSPQSHELRDFLVRNCVPFQWLDIEQDEEARRLVADADIRASSLPIVIFPDGTQLVQPTNTGVAEKIGLTVHPARNAYDFVIVGAGPAGLAAAVYGASEGLRTVMVERRAPGGQAGLSGLIENYLGFPAGLSGADLARRAVAQAKKFEVEIITAQVVTGLRAEGSSRVVTLGDGAQLHCEVVLLALGVEWRRIDVPGIERLTGAGVYYGGTLADAFFCRNEDVYIVGGANAAGQAALYFARYARTVSMLVRGDSLSKSMSRYLIEQIEVTKNIKVRLRTTVVEAHGNEHLERITIFDASTGRKETVATNALFIFIGALPHTEWLKDVVKRDSHGFILTGPDIAKDGEDEPGTPAWLGDRDPFWLESSMPGVFVAGDVRHGSVKRVAAGVGEGATAVQLIHQYLNSSQSGS